MESAFFRHEAEDSVAFAQKASQSADHDNTHLQHLLASKSRFLDISSDRKGQSVRIRYCVLGAREGDSAHALDERPRLMMVMGLAAALDAWKPQIHDIMSIPVGEQEAPVVMCLLDNRGVGQSSCPAKKTHYSTELMAQDAAAVMSEIGWNSAHIVGFSMGGMIACKFASLWPNRVDSLTLISSTRGNWDTLPRSWRAWKYLLKLASDKSATTRASVDLKFHFTKKSLKAKLPGWGSRKDGLMREYIQAQSSHNPTSGSIDMSMTCSAPPSQPDFPVAAAITTASVNSRPARSNLSLPLPPDASATSPDLHSEDSSPIGMPRVVTRESSVKGREPPQDAENGQRGQMYACWKHKLTPQEAGAIKGAKFPVLCIHGRHDLVAEARFGEKLAAQLEATLVLLEGAHFVPRECGHQVSLLIESVVLGQARALERAHLDPERHMQPDFILPQDVLPCHSALDSEGGQDCSASGVAPTVGKRSFVQRPTYLVE